MNGADSCVCQVTHNYAQAPENGRRPTSMRALTVRPVVPGLKLWRTTVRGPSGMRTSTCAMRQSDSVRLGKEMNLERNLVETQLLAAPAGCPAILLPTAPLQGKKQELLALFSLYK